MFWKNKVILLTGASSGLGEGIALELAKRGAVLGLIARRADRLEYLKSRCKAAGGAAGGAARIFAVDVSDVEGLTQAANSLQNEFGRIDMLIANAGIGGAIDAAKFDAEAVNRIINVNLNGAVNSIAAVLPQMIGQKSGHIVGISSLAGYRGLPKSAAYCASKAGFSALLESLRLDLKKHNVSVTTIHPGFIKTPLTAGRENKMPFLMEREDGVAKIISIIEKKKASAAFPFPLSTFVRLGNFFPAWLYDRIAGGANFRE
jgi:short-subunit dehydrogenase